MVGPLVGCFVGLMMVVDHVEPSSVVGLHIFCTPAGSRERNAISLFTSRQIDTFVVWCCERRGSVKATE